MEITKTLLEGIEFAQSIAKASNEGEIQLFFHLQAIALTEIWKQESFYAGAENLAYYKNKKFGALMHDLYNRSTTWFRNMDHILQIPNGKTLYLNHGHSNMVAYMGFSPENKKIVLKIATKRPLANFHSILASVGMKGKSLIANEKDSIWKKKYEELEKKYNTLQKKYNKVKKETISLIQKLKEIEKGTH